MLRAVLSILGGIAVMVFIIFYVFSGMNREEQIHGETIHMGWDHWHQLRYKEIINSHIETQEWSLGTKYGVVHVSADKKDVEMDNKASEAIGAVRKAGSGETLFYIKVSLWLVFTGVVLINRRSLTKKHPHFLKILMFILPIFLLGMVIDGVQAAERASERAEKVFLELEK